MRTAVLQLLESAVECGELSLSNGVVTNQLPVTLVTGQEIGGAVGARGVEGAGETGGGEEAGEIVGEGGTGEI